MLLPSSRSSSRRDAAAAQWKRFNIRQPFRTARQIGMFELFTLGASFVVALVWPVRLKGAHSSNQPFAGGCGGSTALRIPLSLSNRRKWQQTRCAPFRYGAQRRRSSAGAICVAAAARAAAAAPLCSATLLSYGRLSWPALPNTILRDYLRLCNN